VRQAIEPRRAAERIEGPSSPSIGVPLDSALVPTPLRILFFRPESMDILHLRLAIGMTLKGSVVHTLEPSDAGVRTACALLRAGGLYPSLILFELARRDPEANQAVAMIRELPELKSIPFVVLGNGDDPEAKHLALQEGADAFIPLPERASELQRIGKDVARFYWDTQLSKSA
jgi:CheY-like chemotaxis protein